MDPDRGYRSARSEDRHEEDQSLPNKRMRTGPVRRKPACQTCRRRKVRCDNNLPTCGFCSTNEAECVYPDRADDGDKKYVSLEQR